MAQTMEISPQQLQEILKSVLSESRKLNPLEQKKFDEELRAEKRRLEMVATMGRIEQESQDAKKDACSHLRYPASAGEMAGQGAPKGTIGAEWCTGGQAYQNGLAMIICTRCSTTWFFRPTPDYYSTILQNGLRREPPPPPEHTLCNSCFKVPKECRCKEEAEKQIASMAAA